MSRIQPTFDRLHKRGHKALIPYIMAGYPRPALTPELMHGMVAAGADVIELGMPFSDPMADGPIVEKAGQAALRHGVGCAQVLDMVRQFRQRDNTTPVVLMGYANPIERYDLQHGSHAFVKASELAGVDGVLVVDYPPEECADFAASLRQRNMDFIFLLAPTSTEHRMAQVAAMATGYVYYVSLKGVTGASHLDMASVEAMLKGIRRHVKIPVGVGFGIRDATTASAIGRVADAVVIGSRIIEIVGAAPNGQEVAALSQFLTGIKQAL